MSEEKQKLTPIEAINEFYRLKDKYETSYYDKYVKQILKSKKSKKEKRVEYSRLPKHECINCKRNVGTIFTITYDFNDLTRKFISKCGDLTDPCPLDIQISYSIREQFDKLIFEGLNNIENLKLDIIKQKNNALFFKSSRNIINIFDKLTTDLKSQTSDTGYNIEKDILKNENPEKIILLRKSIDEFGIGFVLPFKQMIQDFLKTNDELIINEAVNFYVNEMMPKLKEILHLKYEVNLVEYDEDNKEYYLIQRQNSIENKENFFKDDDNVVKFIMGLRKTNLKNKTKKNVEEELFTGKQNKTKKLKPIIELVEEPEVLIQEGGDQLEDNQLEDNQLEDNQLEDDQLEDNQLEDNQLEDDQLEDDQLEDEIFTMKPIKFEGPIKLLDSDLSNDTN
uniref:Uncharacterized protein n=1 Tax=viral metagenome TaxID=1070528 RepID=A0A6C0KQK2_9ZZZZ